MNPSDFLEALGWAVINSLWQMALLWIVFQLIIITLNPSSFQKSLLATVFLISGFCWFIFTLTSIWKSQPDDDLIISVVLANAAGNEKLNDWLRSTLPVASIIYLVLLILPVTRFVSNYRYVKLIRNHGLEKIGVNWRIFVQKISARMGIKKPVHIWVSELVSSPVTIGWLKPVILIPVAAINHLSTQQLEAIILHELAHIRRYDYLVNLVINFIQTILYFNPFAKAFVRTVEKERERSCDNMVMQFQYGSYEYASALLLLEKQQQSFRQLIVAAAGRKNDLLRRVEMIMGIQKKPLLSFNRIAGLFAGLLCIIAINALLIATQPSQGSRGGSFARISSPFYFFTGDDEADKPVVAASGKKLIDQPARIKDLSTTPITDQPQDHLLLAPPEPAFASIFHPVLQDLKKYEEVQVKEAVEASRKVIENAQWKAIEKEVADAMTTIEKEALWQDVQKEFNKLDWKQWEERLKVAYDKIDWEKINGQLNIAVGQVKLDSLKRAYTVTASQLHELQKCLVDHNLNVIPDSDISLKEIEQKKTELNKKLHKIKSIRNKKIIHL